MKKGLIKERLLKNFHGFEYLIAPIHYNPFEIISISKNFFKKIKNVSI